MNTSLQMLVCYKERLILKGLLITLLAAVFICPCAADANEKDASAPRFTVVLDAGHGGIDKGAVGTSFGTLESDVNLAVAECLKAELEACGVEVVMTRTGDYGLYGNLERGFKRRDMQKRKEIILAASPDLVLSLHCNASSAKYRRGMSVYYSEDNAQARKLAEALRRNALEMEEVNYCVMFTENFFMTSATEFASCILECGFLTNKEEEELLRTDDYRRKIAKAAFAAIYEYLFCDG